ncbi:MAG: hypothetical protein RQ966_18200 [Acetobacteraceae bacterium]|nr:hypothetical protein [Acetobacteraceae bacterium]
MADYYTEFSTVLPIGLAANVAPALTFYRQIADELEAAGETIGFKAAESGTPEAPQLWLHADDNGEPEHIIAFALCCAEVFDLTGLWGFRWVLSASKPLLDAYGGGAHVLDLGRRETVAWLDCDHWLTERLAVGEAKPVPAEALLQPVAAAQGWAAATQAGVLLDFIDALVADDPGVAGRLRAHLAAVSAEPEEMLCRECGEPVVIAAEGTSHHVGCGMDGIDHGRDRDHVAIADGRG